MRFRTRQLESLVSLCHRRWAIPLLAMLSVGPGRRFAEFQRALGVSRQSLRDSLDALASQGLVRPHAGHGHPLRPEYVLTARGRSLAPGCAALFEALKRGGRTDLAARKWSLPVLAGVAAGASRFSEILERLPALGPRALALALKELEAGGVIVRSVGDGHPPSVSYSPSAAGRAIAARLLGLFSR